MKNFTLALLCIFAVQMASAQSSHPVNVSLKIDPITNCQIRYHYFPNLEAYYDGINNLYIYNDKGQWTAAEEIPASFRGYSIYNKMNVPITDYDDDNIVQFINQHRKQFPYKTGRKSREVTVTVN